MYFDNIFDSETEINVYYTGIPRFNSMSLNSVNNGLYANVKPFV